MDTSFRAVTRLIIIVAIASLFCGVILFLCNLILAEPGGVRIAEVVTARNITDAGSPIEQTSSFNQLDLRIYCIIRLSGIASATMSAKWYYGTEEIAGHIFYATPRRPGIIWIEAPDDEAFRRGDYTIDIFVDRTLVRTTHFQIK